MQPNRVSSGASWMLLVLSISACSDSKPTTGEVPPGLRAVEDKAEHAYDIALLGDFAAVATVADQLDAAWQAYRPQAVNDGAPTEDLDAMDTAIAGLQSAAANSMDIVTVARAANAISAPVDELFALYHPKVPPEILALDYMGREVVLDAMERDFMAATADVDTIDATWDGVRAEVVDAGGDMVAADYDASITTLRADITAQDDTALLTDANAELELVDVIEKVF